MMKRSNEESWQNKRTASGPLTVDEPDFITIWLDCDNYIQFVQDLLQRSDLPASLVKDTRTRIEQIQRRRDDRNLYVAVVGEFNSGKSTFINALLRQELLKQSVVVRTAVPTKICYGSTPDIQVLFAGESTLLSYQRDRTQLKKKLRTINAQLRLPSNDDLREYLHLITTDTQIAPRIKEVVVYQPATFLDQNIVIIDTPGTNATDPQHMGVTRRVIEHEADAVVITIPATQALTRTLTEFMQSDLQPFLHRCIPIVTRLDLLDSDEQQMVIDDLNARFPEIIDGQKVTVYEAAPQVLLNLMHPEKDVPLHLQQWHSRFVELEKTIWDRLCYERTMSISESLLRLMTRLLTDLEERLHERQKSYKERQQAIQRETIPDLGEFASSEGEAIGETFVEARNQAVEEAVEALKEVSEIALEQIGTYLGSASTDDEFKAVTEVHASRSLTEARDSYIKKFRTIMSKLQNRVNEAAQLSEAHFTEAYRRLLSVGQVTLSHNVSLSESHLYVPAQDMFSQATQVTADITNQENMLMGGGAVLGGIIGTAMIPIPVLGTIIGGFFGAFFGALFTSDERKREKIAEALLPEISRFFEHLAEAVDESFNTYTTYVVEHIDQNLQGYVDRYSEVVQLVQQQQEQEQQKLQRFQKSVSKDLQEIKRRQILLQQKQQQLKASLFS